MKSSSSEWPVRAPWGKFKMSSCGDISGGRVFLVHGRQDCAATFQPLLELLDNRHYYVSIDMPGSSTSDPFPIGDSRSPSTLLEYITRALKYDTEAPDDGASSLFSDATNQETNYIKKLTVEVDEEVANIMVGMANSDEDNGNSVETIYHTPCEESEFVVKQVDEDGVPTTINEDKKEAVSIAESYNNADVDPNANLPPDQAPNANLPINEDLRLSAERNDETAPNVYLPEQLEQPQILVDFKSISLNHNRTKEEFCSMPIFDVNKCVLGGYGGHSSKISQRAPYQSGGLDATRQYFEQYIYGPVPQGGNAQNNGNIFDNPIRCDDHGPRRCPFATRVPAFIVSESGATPRDMLPPNMQKPKNSMTSNQELGFQVNVPVPRRPPVPPRVPEKETTSLPQEKSNVSKVPINTKKLIFAKLESLQSRGNQVPTSVPELQIPPIPMQKPPRPTQGFGHPPPSSLQAPPYWRIHHPPIPRLPPVCLLEIPLPAIVVKPFVMQHVPFQSAPRSGTYNPQNPTDNNCPFNTSGSTQRCDHLPPGLLEHIHNFFKDERQRPAEPIYNRQSFEKEGAEEPSSPIYTEPFCQGEQQCPAAPSYPAYSHPTFQYGQRLPAPQSYPAYSQPSCQTGQYRPAELSHPTTVQAPFHVNVVPTHHDQYWAPRFHTNSGPAYAHSSMYTAPTPSGAAGLQYGQSSAPICATFEDQSVPTMPLPPRPLTTQPLNSSLYYDRGSRPYTTQSSIYNEYSQTRPDWTPFSIPTSNFLNPRPYSYGDAMRPLTVQTSEAPLQVSEQSAFTFYPSDSTPSPSVVPSPYRRKSSDKERVKIMRFHFLAAMEIAIEHLGWDKFIFIGHSMGCEIGLFFNTLYPGRITKMILLDAEPTLRRLQVHDLTAYQAMFYDNYYNNYEKDNHQYRTYTVPHAKQALMKARNLTPEAASVIVSKSLIHVSGDQYRFSWDRRLKLPAPQNYPNSYYFELFSKIPPALLISASESLNAKSKYKAGSLELISMMSRLKNFQQVTVEGDHDVHLSYPERVASFVNEFLTKSVVLPSKL